MAFLDEILAKLITDGVGMPNVTLGATSKMPVPSNVGQPGGPAFFMTIRETGGTGPSRTQQNGLQRPSAQIAVRALSYTIARSALQAAYDSLGGVNGLRDVVLSGTRYISVTARQEPTDAGIDETGNRVLIVFNIDAEKVPS
jgi:hypothetical protein